MSKQIVFCLFNIYKYQNIGKYYNDLVFKIGQLYLISLKVFKNSSFFIVLYMQKLL